MESLFGRDKQHNQTVTKSGDHFARVDSIDFFGSYAESNNGCFLIAWSDCDPSSGRGGFRDKGLGTYILAENGKMIVTGRMERPNDGKVADNGTFILNDWMFGDGLKGIFWAFDKTGARLIQHKLGANLYNNGISQNGEFAICQLCNSENSDGGSLTFFDLRKGTILWQKVPETGWADSYDFDVTQEQLILNYRDIGGFRYRFDGILLDVAKWEQVSFARASGFELHTRARVSLANLGESQDRIALERILEVLNVALHRALDKYPNEQAEIYRTMGEVKERLGRIAEAVSDYERALALNPKVGLKRKLASMQAKKPN